jgi:hypothetical protein
VSVFDRLFHDYIKHTHRLDWLQQIFQWLYQTHPSPRLTSAGFSMTISNTPIASTDFTRFCHDYIKHNLRFDWLSDGCVWYSHGKTCWRQSKGWMCLIYSWKNLLKSVEAKVVFDIVMAKPGEVSRGDGCVWYSHWKTWFFHDYIKHSHRLDGLQQVFPWLYQTHPSSRRQLKRCVLDIVMEKPAEVSQDDGCVWYSHGTSCWNPSKRWVCLI